MHLRPKPWARPELEACGFFLAEPWTCRGQWQSVFARRQPLHLELGCGKGQFISQLGAAEPDVNFLAIDMIDAVLGLAQRAVRKTYGNRPVDNLRLTAWDISRIETILGPQDRVERIYINFCNPWPRHRYHKKRLTHPRQLEKYRAFLSPGAEIRFKTDDDALFADSLKYFENSGFSLNTVIRDLQPGQIPGDVVTEHQAMFTAQSIPIKYLRAVSIV
jgi:tRNA (guanine-N7-)-methyltransferase